MPRLSKGPCHSGRRRKKWSILHRIAAAGLSWLELAESVKKRFLSLCNRNYVALRLLPVTLGTAWLEAAPGESGLFSMPSFPQAVLGRIRSLRAFVAASLRKLLGVTAHDGDFASQRMCPFCGLITPRHGVCCLECGKSLKPA